MTIRLKDIAAASGVSVGAVQQILAGRGERFREETRTRVLECATSLGYRPDVNAMALRTGRSYLVGVLLSGVNYAESNGFFEGVQAGLSGTEYAPICFTHNGCDEEGEFIRRCMDRRVDGLILNTAVDSDSGQHTRSATIPDDTPLIEVFGNFLEGVPSITNDDEQAGRIAVDHLVAIGCDRISLFTHDQYDRYQKDVAPFFNAWRFYLGCAAAAQAHGMQLSVRTHSLAIFPRQKYESAWQSVKQWPVSKAGKEGYCCFGIEQGRALIDCFQTSQIGVEERFAAVVYGDSRVFCDRPDWVAMVQPDVRSVSRVAAEGLLRLIERESVPNSRVESELILN